MQVFTDVPRLPASLSGTALALGYFDGVHLGHQAVLRAAVQAAQNSGLLAAAFTFTGSPKPAASALLQTPEARQAAMAALGLQYCFTPPFASFCSLTPEAFFTQKLIAEYKAKALFCGPDFAFGAHRAGDVALLQALCEAHGLALSVLPKMQYDGAPVSSTRVRAALAAGNIEDVNNMLARPYSISLPVVAGRHLGRTLGFPTINQVYPGGLQPPGRGVYITATLVEGRSLPSVTGYGNRPTVDGGADTCETFIPGFSGDLYGTKPEIYFYRRISDIQKFNSLEQLAAAVRRWAAEAEAYFKHHPLPSL